MSQPVENLDPAQQAYRYLFCRVGLEAGLFELLAQEEGPNGLRLVCKEMASGKPYVADRPSDWSEAEEEAKLADMRTKLMGEMMM
ncbi:MAG: hypothetical protein EXR58_06740 [Chloroflexi bacterium]|nr:hypothetical protein [Chloroflexota bacterium]